MPKKTKFEEAMEDALNPEKAEREEKMPKSNAYSNTPNFEVIKEEGQTPDYQYKIIRHGQLIGQYKTLGDAQRVAKAFNIAIKGKPF